ncbi:MAG: hypothetical protein SGCHY_000027 [Lobulomycetales sp.]
MLLQIVGLSLLLSIGILSCILSCALWANWLPLLPLLVFVLAPIPNLLCSRLHASAATFFSSSSPSHGFLETGYFITAFLVSSGLGLPLVLLHSGAITFWAMLLSVIGGSMVYATIVGYMALFIASPDENGF